MDKNEQGNNKRAKEEVLICDKNKKMRNSLLPNKTPLDKSTQLTIIGKIRAKSEGPRYMWLSMKWYIKWEAYCLELKGHPSSIDNSDLFKENGEIRDNLVINKDYCELPLNAWLHLESWYGVKDRSFIISKKAGEKEDDDEQLVPKKPTPKQQQQEEQEEEADLKFCLFIVNKSSKERYLFTASPDFTVYDFQAQLLSVLKQTPGTVNMELWLLNNQNTFLIEKLISNPFIIKPSLLNQGERFAKRIDPSIISPQSTISDCLSLMSFSKSTSKNGQQYYLAIHFLKKELNVVRKPLGLCGLQNLGNTCYMNSAIQCLSHTPQLTHYFLSEKYKQNINTSSALGLKGTLAEAYASLLKSMYKPNQSNRFSLSPKEFKTTMEQFNEQFSGYLQQDSQEFLGCLLDGLHEDLNKVLRKPYIESSDSDEDVSDMEMATKSWNYHKSRDDSFVVDLFQGQYKSRLICDVCKKVSVTFDTFMYLSLPLPMETHYEINLVYVPYLPSERLLSMSIQLNKDAQVKDLKQEVENNMSSSFILDSLVVVTIENGKINKVFDNEDAISLIHTDDTVYVYQLPCSIKDEKKVTFPVYCSTVQEEEKSSQFGYPFLLVIDKDPLLQAKELYHLIVFHLERYCIVKLFEEDTHGDKKESMEELTQQSIHTAAASGRPTVPMRDLFTLRLFETDALSMYPFEFPLHDKNTHYTWVDHDTIQQGQGVVLEWPLSKAQQIFGESQQGVNTEAWFDYVKTSSKKIMPKRQFITLEDCLNEYSREEKMSGEDAWYCPRCKKLQYASKKIDIWKLPDIMVIHLKRFSQVRRWGNKVNTYIDFPLTDLDMTTRVIQENDQQLVYDLYAVDNHYGGLHGGHYTAFAKNIETSNWYEFDDTRVSKIAPENIKTNAAYLLFYKRR